MKNNALWMRFISLSTNWQRLLLSLFLPFCITAFYYFFIFSHYQQEIIKQQTIITQKQILVAQYQSTLQQMPSIVSLKALQDDYEIPAIYSYSGYERLKNLLQTFSLIPEKLENDQDTLYRLTFTLSYSHFLHLLEMINRAGFSLTTLDVTPQKNRQLAVHISITDLSKFISPQGEIS